MEIVTLGEYLKKARKEKKLSYKKLAELIQVDRTYLSKIENHGWVPSEKVIKKLAKELGDNLIEFIYEQQKNPKPSSDIKKKPKNLDELKRDALWNNIYDSVVNPWEIGFRPVGTNNPKYPAYIKDYVRKLIAKHIPFAADNEKLINRLADDFTKAYRDHENALSSINANLDRFVNLLTRTPPSEKKYKSTIKLKPIKTK